MNVLVKCRCPVECCSEQHSGERVSFVCGQQWLHTDAFNNTSRPSAVRDGQNSSNTYVQCASGVQNSNFHSKHITFRVKSSRTWSYVGWVDSDVSGFWAMTLCRWVGIPTFRDWSVMWHYVFGYSDISRLVFWHVTLCDWVRIPTFRDWSSGTWHHVAGWGVRRSGRVSWDVTLCGWVRSPTFRNWSYGLWRYVAG